MNTLQKAACTILNKMLLLVSKRFKMFRILSILLILFIEICIFIWILRPRVYLSYHIIRRILRS